MIPRASRRKSREVPGYEVVKTAKTCLCIIGNPKLIISFVTKDYTTVNTDGEDENGLKVKKKIANFYHSI